MRSAAALALALAVGPAAAQEPPAAELLRLGNRLRRERRDGEALAAFDRAWARCRCAEALADRGLAAEALGRWVDAERDLSAALDDARDPFVRAYGAHLRTELAAVRARLATVTVAVDAPGAHVAVDDGPAVGVPAEGLALRLAEGGHRLTVGAPGRVAAAREVSVRGGRDARLELSLREVPAPAAPLPLVAERPRPAVVARPPSARRAAPVAWLAGAGGALAAGVAAHVAQQLLVARWNSDACLAGGLSRVENCAAEGAAADATLGVAIAGYAAAGALLVVAAARWARAPSAAGRAWACAPSGGGAACALSF